MSPAEARGLYAQMLAIWPGAKSQHQADTAQAWVALLADTPADDARAAVVELRVSADWFPSMAQMHQSVADARVIRAERNFERRELNASSAEFDVSGRARVLELVAWLKQPREPITYKHLDEGGVKNWRGRLNHAREEDERMCTTRNWDATWAQLREELGRGPLVLPDGRTFG